MQQTAKTGETGEKSGRWTVWRPRAVLAAKLLGVVVVFLLGVAIGQGRLSFNNSGSSLNPGLPNQLDYASVNQVYQSLKANYDGKLTESQLLDGLKHGLADATNDPYTVYFTAKEAKQFSNELNNSFSGIGAELGKDSAGDLIVVSPIAGFPAEKAGLKPQDIIAAIDGKTTSGMSIDQAVTAIRGPVGSTVNLQIIRDHSQQLNLKIVRQNIQVPSVNSKVLPGNIGYIQISTFADDTSSLIQQTADKLQQDHVKGIVLDLRDDPGGLLTAAVSVSSKWLPQGTLVLQEKRGNTVVNSYYAEGGDVLHGIPTVVLVNGGSASASEITTGALHDNHAAYVIGTKSFGKGVVQQLINFKDGSELKVTVASWYRPDGQNINHKGITPDQTVSEPSSATPDNDPQLQAAEAYLAGH